MRSLNIKRKYFLQIKSGQKTVEVRVGYSSINRIAVDDKMLLQDGQESITVRVVAIRRYRSFAEMLTKEDAGSVIPNKGAEDVLAILQSIYPPDKEALGVVALQLQIVQ